MANYFDNELDAPEVATIAQLAQKIVYRVPGCDDLTVRMALREAFADFARLSCCFTTWRKVKLEVNKDAYPVAPIIPGMFVSAITYVVINRRKLLSPMDYTILTGATPIIALAKHHVPEEIDREAPKVHIRAVELPKEGSERAPSWFLEKFGGAVASGALVRLFGMSGRAWADAEQARMEATRWENALTTAKIDSYRADASQNGEGNYNPIDMSGVL